MKNRLIIFSLIFGMLFSSSPMPVQAAESKEPISKASETIDISSEELIEDTESVEEQNEETIESDSIAVNYYYDSDKLTLLNHADNDSADLVTYIDGADLKNFDEVIWLKMDYDADKYAIIGATVTDESGKRNRDFELFRYYEKGNSDVVYFVQYYDWTGKGKPTTINIHINIVEIANYTLSVDTTNGPSGLKVYVDDVVKNRDSNGEMTVSNSESITLKWPKVERKRISLYKISDDGDELLYADEEWDDEGSKLLGYYYVLGNILEDTKYRFDVEDEYTFNVIMPQEYENDFVLNVNEVVKNEETDEWEELNYINVGEEYRRTKDHYLRFYYDRIAYDDSIYDMEIYELSGRNKTLMTPVEVIDANTYIYKITADRNKKMQVDFVEPPKSQISFVVKNATINNDTMGVIEGQISKYIGHPLKFTISPDDGYEVYWVSATGSSENTIGPDEFGEYTFIPDASTETITVKTIPCPQIVTFDNMLNDPSSVELIIEDNELIKEYEEFDETHYKLIYGLDSFEFKLVSKTKGAPSVGFVNDALNYKLINVQESQDDNGDYVYTYKISTNLLCHVDTLESVIHIDEPKDNSDVVFTLEADEGIESAIIYVNGTEQSGSTVNMKYGDTVSISLVAKNGFFVGDVDYDNKYGVLNKKTVLQEKTTIQVPLLGDTKMTVNAKERGSVGLIIEKIGEVIDGTPYYYDEPQVIGSDERYSLYSSSYTLRNGLYKARYMLDGKQIKVSGVKGGGLQFDVDDEGTISFELYDSMGSKSYYLINLTLDTDGMQGFKRYTMHTLRIYPVRDCSAIKVSRYKPEPKEEGETLTYNITQLVDTKVSYLIMPDDSEKTLNTKVDCIKLCITDSEDNEIDTSDLSISTRVRGRTLYLDVITANTVKDNLAKIHLYREDAKVDNNKIVYEKNEMAVLNVSTCAPTALTENSLRAAELKESDDVSLTFSVREPARVKRSYYGKQLYKVEVTPKDSLSDDSPFPNETQTFWFEREYPVLIDYPDDATDAQMETIDRQNEEIDRNYTQPVKVRLAKMGVNSGSGCACNFDVKISMVQTLPGNSADDSANYSSLVTELTASTKDPSYETKLSVKKAATSAYTGQRNVLVGTASFSSGTVCSSVIAEDVTEGISAEQKVDVYVDDNTKTVSISVPRRAAIGKHTIAVSPTGTNSMYIPPVNLAVTVVMGISNIDVTAVSEIYKQTGRDASYQVGVIFNKDSAAPAVKKVTYSLVDENGAALSRDVEYTTSDTVKILPTSAADKITISSAGKILIAKDFEITSNNNKIRVRVDAADYEGNTVVGLSNVITITNEPLEIKTLKMLQMDENGKYVSVGTYDSAGVLNVTSDQVEGSILAAFSEEYYINQKSFSTRELLDEQIAIDDLSWTSSNAAIKLAYGTNFMNVNPTKVGNGITIKATTTDGGKKSASLKINQVYQSVDRMTLQVDDTTMMNEETFEYKGTPNTVLTLKVLQNQTEGETDWTELSAYTNHNLSIKGGKICSSDANKGIYKVIVTSATATVTLKDQSKKSAVTTKYYLSNTAFKTQNAPKIKVSGSLKSNTPDQQRIDLLLSDKNYDFTNKYVRLEVDAASASVVKTAANYAAFENGCVSMIHADPVEIINEDSKHMISVGFEGTSIPDGTYKAVALIGELDENGDLVPDVKPVTISIKVAKPKVVKGNFKPKTSLEINTKNGMDEVEMTASGSAVSYYDFTQIFNCNFGGVENEFKEYFTLAHDENNKPFIQMLISDADPEYDKTIAYLKSSASKNDRTCYALYEAEYGDDGYGNTFRSSAIVKITITVK